MFRGREGELFFWGLRFLLNLSFGLALKSSKVREEIYHFLILRLLAFKLMLCIIILHRRLLDHFTELASCLRRGHCLLTTEYRLLNGAQKPAKQLTGADFRCFLFACKWNILLTSSFMCCWLLTQSFEFFLPWFELSSELVLLVEHVGNDLILVIDCFPGFFEVLRVGLSCESHWELLLKTLEVLF